MLKRGLATLVLISLAACHSIPPIKDTGVGRAWDVAWWGVPEEIDTGVRFMNVTMMRELEAKYKAVYEAPVTNPDGSVNEEWAHARFLELESLNSELDAWQGLSEALSEYLGVNLGSTLPEELERTRERRRAFWRHILDNSRKKAEEFLDE